MHIKFDASGRERRMVFVNAPDDDDALLQQAQKNSAKPMQNFEFDIQKAAGEVLSSVDDAYTKSRSSWLPWKWFGSREEADAADARAGTNEIVNSLIEQAGVQAKKETDKTYAMIHELAESSSDKYFFHSLRLRTLEKSLQEHRDRKDKLVNALKAYASLCAQSGLPLDGDILKEQQKRIESLDQRTVRYESLLEKSKERVNAQRGSAEFKNLEAIEDKLRRVLLRRKPSLANDIEELLRDAIGGGDRLQKEIGMQYGRGPGPMNAEGQELLRIAKELAGNNTWFFTDWSKRKQAADYYSTRLMEKRDLNPAELGKRLTMLGESRIGQRVRMTIGGNASTYILMDRPGNNRLELRLINGNGPAVALLSTDATPSLIYNDGTQHRLNLSAPQFRASDDAAMTYLAA